MYRDDQPTEADKRKEKMIVAIICAFCLALLGYWLITDLKKEVPTVASHTVNQLAPEGGDAVKGFLDEMGKRAGDVHIDENTDERQFEYEINNAFGK